MSFKPVSATVDFPALERELLDYWYSNGIVEKYLEKNKQSLPSKDGKTSDKKFSFLDGPITANNPMGVHHAWGRTYKDLWQRFYNMKGCAQRFQNGFDEQGLWVEVEVEKELGLHSKKDILNLVEGDEFASLERFVNLCKERVKKYSGIQTEQSKRLGYFMDWNNSYHTSSEENNYAIWNYLKVVNDKGWIYKGHDSVPWCPRCGTAISQHEILTEDYKELTHDSIYFKLPLKDKENEYLLVWTTTPWTIPANVAVAVNGEEQYISYQINEIEKVWIMEKSMKRLQESGILPTEPAQNQKTEAKLGKGLVGWEYEAPFDSLERVKKAMNGQPHRIVIGDPQILLVGADEGTGLVHIAPGAGSEDFQLGKKEALPVIEVIDEAALYLDQMGDFRGQNAKSHPEIIIDYLKEYDGGKFLLTTQKYTHRYPACWRCKTELVWRVVDEWYINMDGKDEGGKTYREEIKISANQVNWRPKWAKDRELDWLNNMHDWLISKKRFWGLSLPIWECKDCDSFDVIGSKEELKERAEDGWDKFEGHTPHRPWIDQIKIKCSKCNKVISRVPDVGNPWLDAGIVPFSTLPEGWFPADFVTEGFPGQFKNWFYSLLAMSTGLKQTTPFKNLLGFANLVDEKGNAMHKSAGNSIEFNEAADQAGVDPIRWLYATSNPEVDLRFGYNTIDEIRRRFYLILWNSYKFFVDYASISDWKCELTPTDINSKLTVLDKWILARLTEVIILVNISLENFDAMSASRAIEDFVVRDFSTWYIRRSRDRVGPSSETNDQNIFLSVSFGVLVTLSKLLAPFMPFISEEIYKNLTGGESVHLERYPLGDQGLLDKSLIEQMERVRSLVEVGHSQRKDAGIKLRQPLSNFIYGGEDELSKELGQVLMDELNVKSLDYDKSSKGNIDINITPELKIEGDARELIRDIQKLRKEKGLTLKDKIRVLSPINLENSDFKTMVLKQTNATDLNIGENLEIELVNV